MHGQGGNLSNRTIVQIMIIVLLIIDRQLCVPDLSLVKLKRINQSLAGLNAKCTDPSQMS